MISIVEIIRSCAERASQKFLKNGGRVPVKFFADNYSVIGNDLTKRGTSTKAAREKYPAILLFCDRIIERKAPELKQYDVEFMLHLLIVAESKYPLGIQKRENVFYPILYPIYDAFAESFLKHPQILSKDVPVPKWDKIDRYDLVAMMGNNRLFADKLDGIEIKNLRLFVKKENCLTGKNLKRNG